ncbi:cyclin-P isoform X2 [Rhineura floridana]|uniref:cyclin-P isoform X2 n=1 Tax=Rhineura floridana TaxID=261503 RepID=UPI002AC827F1|nr:cyclin-P isoform X2 [Rhineura floridana]
MWGVLAKPTTVCEMRPWLGLQSKAEDKREPLKSKNNKDLNNGKGSRKKVQGSQEKGPVPEKPGAVCPRTSAEPPWQRGRRNQGPCRELGQVSQAACTTTAIVPVSEFLVEELSQAMMRLEMGLEREYAYDIFSSLMKQPHYAFRGFDLLRSVTAEMRALVVDWLVQVHEYLDLADETLYLAVYLMNAYMKAGKVPVRSLQLLGITCLFLACKVEESALPEPAQLCSMTEDSFSPTELLRMERKILRRLQFELHYTNPVHLLRLLAEVGHCTLEVVHLGMYFLELSLVEGDCLHFEPAQLTLAALGLAQRVLQQTGLRHLDALLDGSPNLPSYSESELSAVYPYMAKAALQGPTSTFRATFLKYSRPQKLCTSTSPAIAASTCLSCCLGSPTP